MLEGYYRIVGILAQIALSGIVFSSRVSQNFPAKASSLAILPAACFENMAAASNLGLSNIINSIEAIANNETASLTQFSHNLADASSLTGGIWEYGVLLVFLALVILVLG